MKTLFINGLIDLNNLRAEKKWAFYTLIFISLVLIALSINRVVIYMSDFNMFIDPAVDAKFFNKDPITTWTNNAYSPFFYSVMSVFTVFSRWFAVFLWSVLSLGFMVIIMQIVKHFLADKLSFKHYIIGIAIMLFSLVDNFQLGQCNVLLLSLMLIALYYSSIDKPMMASIFLGFAIAYKLIPLLLIFYFLLKGKYKVVVYSTVIAVAFTLIVPFFFYSFDKTILYTSTWFNGVLKPFFTGGEMEVSTASFYFTNQSLDAFLGRYLTSFGKEKYDFDLLITLPIKTVKTIGISLKLIYILAIALIIKYNSKDKFGVFALLIYGILFISPVAWVSYYIFILPMVFLCISYWKQMNSLIKGIFILGCLLILVDINRAVQMYSLHFIGGFLVFIATYIIVFKNRKNDFRAY